MRNCARSSSCTERRCSVLIDTQKALGLSIADFTGESVAVLGIKGSGKSNSSAVVAEEMLSAGMPMCIVDIAGEYYGLRERFAVLVAGRGPNVDVQITPDHGASLAEFSLRQGVPIILDLGDIKPGERFELLSKFFETLWTVAGEVRKPYMIFVEEARNFIPQGSNTPVKDQLIQIASEGRKRGLGIVLVGQRSSAIDKNVLTQAGILVLHRVRHPTDVSVYQDILPLPRGEVKETVNALATGEAMIVKPNGDVARACIRVRHTFHGGYTPTLDSTSPPDPLSKHGEGEQSPELKRVDSALIEQLRAALAEIGDVKEDEPPLVVRLRQTIHEQAQVIRERDERVAKLAAQVVKLEADIKRLQKAAKLPGDQGMLPEPIGLNGTDQVVNGLAVRAKMREQTAITSAHRRQEQRFKLLVAEVRSSTEMHREVLAYLLAHPGKHAVERLARSLGYEPGRLYKNPPTGLMRSGLIFREQKAKGEPFEYWADTKKLVEMFPALPQSTMVAALQRVEG